MLRYRTLYLPWFVIYIEWKSVRLELLTSIYAYTQTAVAFDTLLV